MSHRPVEKNLTSPLFALCRFEFLSTFNILSVVQLRYRTASPEAPGLHKPFSSGPTSRYLVIVGYVVVSLIACAIGLELLLWIAWSAHSLLVPNQQPEQASSPAYSRYVWAPEFWKEESQRSKVRRSYIPFRVWGNVPWHGRYVNNDESEAGILRRTVGASSSECAKQEQTRVWVFGGSVVYGLGVPDWATLPSYLAHDLTSATRRCVVVTNFGVEGYVSNQELIFLMERLKASRPPDIAIFYDGLNDTSAVLLNPTDPSHSHFSVGTIGARVQGSLTARLDFLQRTYSGRFAKLIVEFVHRRASPVSGSNLADITTAAVDNYEGNIRLAKALAQAYNFKLYWFWQPSIYYGAKPLVPFEQRLANIKDQYSITSTAVYEEAERRASRDGNFVFLGDLFDSVKEPIYVDQVHTGPRGNELAAEAIVHWIAVDSK
jgi:lysophospholipase L1-like esterase